MALFCGAGGGILGGRILGWTTVAACEIDPYCQRVLLARQREGALERFPIWPDVCTLDGTPWRGSVDVITAGWPCQGFSAAGKGRGFDDERSGLWVEVARLVSEVRPPFVFLENSPRLVSSGGLARCLSDLAALGYDAAWDIIGARHVGAPHRRDRCWILGALGNADSKGKPTIAKHDEASRVPGVVANSDRWNVGHGVQQVTEPRRSVAPELGRDGTVQPMADTNSEPAKGPRHKEDCGKAAQNRKADQPRGGGQVSSATEPANVADTKRPRLEGFAGHERDQEGREKQAGPVAAQGVCGGGHAASWWAVEPDVGRVVDGVADRMDRLRAIGNGQVPQVAAFAFEALRARLDGRW